MLKMEFKEMRKLHVVSNLVTIRLNYSMYQPTLDLSQFNKYPFVKTIYKISICFKIMKINGQILHEFFVANVLNNLKNGCTSLT